MYSPEEFFGNIAWSNPKLTIKAKLPLRDHSVELFAPDVALATCASALRYDDNQILTPRRCTMKCKGLVP